MELRFIKSWWIYKINFNINIRKNADDIQALIWKDPQYTFFNEKKQGICYNLNGCISAKCICWNFNPKRESIVGRAFGRYLGSWGWSPLKRLQRDPLPFSPYKDTVRRYQQHPRKKDLTRRNTTQLVVFHYSNPNRLSSPNGTSQYFSIISTGLEKKDIYKGKIFLENSFYFICFNTKIVSLLHL